MKKPLGPDPARGFGSWSGGATAAKLGRAGHGSPAERADRTGAGPLPGACEEDPRAHSVTHPLFEWRGEDRDSGRLHPVRRPCQGSGTIKATCPGVLIDGSGGEQLGSVPSRHRPEVAPCRRPCAPRRSHNSWPRACSTPSSPHWCGSSSRTGFPSSSLAWRRWPGTSCWTRSWRPCRAPGDPTGPRRSGRAGSSASRPRSRRRPRRGCSGPRSAKPRVGAGSPPRSRAPTWRRRSRSSAARASPMTKPLSSARSWCCAWSRTAGSRTAWSRTAGSRTAGSRTARPRSPMP